MNMNYRKNLNNQNLKTVSINAKNVLLIFFKRNIIPLSNILVRNCHKIVLFKCIVEEEINLICTKLIGFYASASEGSITLTSQRQQMSKDGRSRS